MTGGCGTSVYIMSGGCGTSVYIMSGGCGTSVYDTPGVWVHSVYAMPCGCGYSIAISGRCGLYLHYFLLIVTLQNVATLHVYMCSTSQ